MRKLKGLEDIVGESAKMFLEHGACHDTVPSVLGLTAVSPRTGPEGWAFAPADDFPGTDADTVNGAQHVRDLYFKADPNYSGRYGLLYIYITSNVTQKP